MSETPRTDHECLDGIYVKVDFAEELEKELTALQAENVKLKEEIEKHEDVIAVERSNAYEIISGLRADIAAKDAALLKADDAMRRLFWTSDDGVTVRDGAPDDDEAPSYFIEAWRAVRGAQSPNPPVYVPGEIVAKLVKAVAGYIIAIKTNQTIDWIEKARTLDEALALARPFIAKGEKL